MPTCEGCSGDGDGVKVTLWPRKCGDSWRAHESNYTIIGLFGILPLNRLYGRLTLCLHIVRSCS